MRARGLVTAVAALGLAAGGCGAGTRDDAVSTSPKPTRVTVVIRPQGDGGPERGSVVDCPRDARCARLERADFSRPKATTACSQIYGGKATALVTGRIDGREVYETFDLVDGCAVARWNRFAWLLGAPPKG